MPCGKIPCDADEDRSIPNSDTYYDHAAPYKRKIELLTRISCEYFTQLEAQGIKIPEYAISWWQQHKEEDKIRIETELRIEKEIKRRQLEQALKNKKDAEEIIKKLTSTE